jgi:uncharacterized protein (DUF1501 family)
MLSRRSLLKAGASLGALSVAGGSSFAWASAETDQRFVMVILRGAADGLALVPAIGDPNYEAQRGELAIQDAIPLDTTFGLNPGLAALEPLWRTGELAVIHATHTSHRARSHFDAQNMLESGLNKPSSVTDGWMNRALGYFNSSTTNLGLAAGHELPLILSGAMPVTVWAPRLLDNPEPAFLQKLQSLSASDPQIQKALQAGAKEDARQRAMLGDLEAARAGVGRYGLNLQLAAATGKLLAADNGARFASFDLGGWDTHGSQAIALSYLLPNLARTLLALKHNLGSAWSKTVVLVVSEFGRTVMPNGTNGTDHGEAGVALVLGGGVKGGQVFSDWPGLATAQLYEERDLRPTTDIRTAFKSVMIEHLMIDAAFVEAKIFPGTPDIKRLDGLIAA